MIVNYEKKGRIAIVTINRPEVMNALNLETRKALNEAFTDFQNDPELWVGILTGAGDKAFCAGTDLKSSDSAVSPPEEQERNTEDYSILRENKMWKPLIAAINGYCFGAGMETALLCDIRIAADHARLGMPEVTRGLIPLGGGLLRLPRMLNWCHATEMLLMGKQIEAAEAYRMGLVNKVVPLDQLMPTVMQWAEEICQASPLAVRAAKEAIIRGSEMTIEEGSNLVRELTENVRQSEDYAEGRQAFREKRKPDYKGR